MVATDQIIKELCKETGDPAFLNYTSFEGPVLDAIRDLSIFNMPSFSHAELELNEYNAVEWPTAVVKPLAVLLVRNGEAMILDVDVSIENLFPEKVSPSNASESDNFIQDAFAIDGGRFAWTRFFNWGLGELYGLQSYRGYGTVTHHKSNRQSYIKGNFMRSDDKIVMFYVTDGLECLPKFVPSECKTAVESYALYKFFRVRDTNKSQVFLKDYKENFTRLNKFWTADDDQTWIAAMSSNVKSSPK